VVSGAAFQSGRQRFSTNRRRVSANSIAGETGTACFVYTGAMASRILTHRPGRFSDLPLAVRSILGFWLFYFGTVMLRAVVIGHGINEMLLRRSAGIMVGVALTFGVYVALRLFARAASLKRMIVVAAIASIPAAILYSAFNFNAFLLYEPLVARPNRAGTNITVLRRTERGQIEVQPAPPLSIPRELWLRDATRQIADGAVTWYFFFAAWASFYVAMSAGNQLRIAERRASEFERAAQSAQLRALRYQVNPHFLFNTLNSLSSLIMSRREEEAERMILNLSNFFRSTLAVDPTDDLTLSEEIRFQMMYLDIEKARFPNRLRVITDVPSDLKSMRLPALLLQPIIENAIKYGVARAREPVTLTVKAREEEGRLALSVEDDAQAAGGGPGDHGTGVGLRNVCQRLQARFGDAAECRHGPRPGGGYLVTLTMPLVRGE
jgi:two-component system, LytTR family, sensor kinase